MVEGGDPMDLVFLVAQQWCMSFWEKVSNPSTLEKKTLNSSCRSSRWSRWRGVAGSTGQGGPVLPLLGDERGQQEEATWPGELGPGGEAGASGRGTGRGTAGAPTSLACY